MKKIDLIKILKNIGLSDNEAKVYLGALNMGPASIQQIARSAEIKRTTVYQVVESLKLKGLMNMEVKGFKHLYVAEDPNQIKQVTKKQLEQVDSAIPQLLALYNLKGGESTVKYYEGAEGIKSVYEMLLKRIKPHEDYLVIGAQESWYGADPKYFQKFIERRAKLPINIRLILQDSSIARKQKMHEKAYNEEIKIFPQKSKFSSTLNMVITPSIIVFHQLIPPVMAIVIESPQIIKAHQELFEIIWNSLPE